MTDRRSPEARAWRALYQTPQWKALRRAQLAAHPFCSRHPARLVQATVVNHRRPHKGDRDLFFDPSNLESVCKDCHDGPIQKDENRGMGCAVDPDGYPLSPTHRANRSPRGRTDRAPRRGLNR